MLVAQVSFEQKHREIISNNLSYHMFFVGSSLFSFSNLHSLMIANVENSECLHGK